MATITPDADGESLRDALDDAFEQHSDDNNSGADAPAAKAAPAEPPASQEEAASKTTEGQQRDASGKFAPKAKEAPAQGLEGTQGAANAPAGAPAPIGAAPAPGELKAPASWTPQAREQWAAVPEPLKAEIHRRESELGRVMMQGAQQRQFVDAFENIVRPYEMFIRAENSNPLQAVQNLMQTAAEFRVGTPARKVELVAGIIRNFGIDLEALDASLAGHITANGHQQTQAQQFRDPRVDQLLSMQQQQLQYQRQNDAQQVNQTLQAFGSTHEFYGDVRGLMGDILEMKAKRGEALDLEAAYKLACNSHEGVSTILAQRQAGAKSAPGPSPAVLRAKRAASSVKQDGHLHDGGFVPKDDSLRAALEAAIEQQANG